ncbi:secreted RxLR effector peptide protein, putative [Phytophthora infestans T30-4]|uniref:Secreted RxLR effector peptide protein, putative n=3 Tax=Phytophthora infestans TaxID=4787 RepID=D0NGY2_PHYIT|nr:secreted RxLR effector peptide protein, putative [Phytophthora infestans T30-4]EEY58621.1 secreted RxLR effector peptide protein, putative [Phytophthora infestans T30-4]KAF4148881.1 hypothetical protein GN958_ATG01955 [Phytophthora infestans]|eukprot:XP_002901565.1 secreted RxLR effector peptide protein, putative [Phytophthora infestans T30-4]
MRVSFFILLVATALMSTTKAVDNIDGFRTARNLREHHDDEARSISNIIKRMKILQDKRNSAKVEKLLKRDVSAKTLYKKTKVHPEKLHDILNLKKLHEQEIKSRSTNAYVSKQFQKYTDYKEIWK